VASHAQSKIGSGVSYPRYDPTTRKVGIQNDPVHAIVTTVDPASILLSECVHGSSPENILHQKRRSVEAPALFGSLNGAARSRHSRRAAEVLPRRGLFSRALSRKKRELLFLDFFAWSKVVVGQAIFLQPAFSQPVVLGHWENFVNTLGCSQDWLSHIAFAQLSLDAVSGT